MFEEVAKRNVRRRRRTRRWYTFCSFPFLSCIRQASAILNRIWMIHSVCYSSERRLEYRCEIDSRMQKSLLVQPSVAMNMLEIFFHKIHFFPLWIRVGSAAAQLLRKTAEEENSNIANCRLSRIVTGAFACALCTRFCRHASTPSTHLLWWLMCVCVRWQHSWCNINELQLLNINDIMTNALSKLDYARANISQNFTASSGRSICFEPKFGADVWERWRFCLSDCMYGQSSSQFHSLRTLHACKFTTTKNLKQCVRWLVRTKNYSHSSQFAFVCRMCSRAIISSLLHPVTIVTYIRTSERRMQTQRNGNERAHARLATMMEISCSCWI